MHRKDLSNFIAINLNQGTLFTGYTVIGTQVIVEGIEKHDPLNACSVLWMTEGRTPLGIVDEIFGPMRNPFMFDTILKMKSLLGSGGPLLYVVLQNLLIICLKQRSLQERI